jgi:proline dehydrogenase
MSDNMTFTLGHAGYKAYKYVPYGKVHEVMPYLIRRAQENSDALSGAKEESKMMAAELRRRVMKALHLT